VTAKLDQRGVEILVQPEFFVNDTVRPQGMWAPDTLKASATPTCCATRRWRRSSYRS
jgi:hypothetical protein